MQRRVDAADNEERDRSDDGRTFEEDHLDGGVDDLVETLADASMPPDGLGDCAATGSGAGAFSPREPMPYGPCDSPPHTQRVQRVQPRLSVPLGGSLSFDIVESVVVERSQSGETNTRGKLAIGTLIEISRMAERRLLAGIRHTPAETGVQRPAACDADELVLLGFDDPDRPAVLARTPILGDIALIASVEAESSRRVYVIADEVESKCVRPTKQAYLYVFDLDGEFRPRERIELGAELAVAERLGDLLVLIDGTSLSSQRGAGVMSSARTVALEAAGEVVVSTDAPAPFVGLYPPPLSMGLDGDVLGLLVDDWESGGLRYVRYDTSEPSELHVRSDCTSSVLSSHMQGVFFGDRVIAATWAAAFGEGAPITNQLVELDAQCQTKRELVNAWIVDVQSAGVAIEFQAAEGRLEARLLDSITAEVLATAYIETADGHAAEPWHARVNREPASPVSGDALEPGVACVPTKDAQLECFSFSSQTIVPCTGRLALCEG